MVIRPLYYVRERDIARWSTNRNHPIIPCNLCGSQENLERPLIKRMLAEWDAIQPGRVDNIARAMRHVVPSHLGDGVLVDFEGLRRTVELMPTADVTEGGSGLEQPDRD